MWLLLGVLKEIICLMMWRKIPQTVFQFSLTSSSFWKEKITHFRNLNCISKPLSSRKMSWFFCFIVISKFSGHWAYNYNCWPTLANDRFFNFYKTRSSFFPAFYLFTQCTDSKKIITNNAWRMVQLMLIYTTN